MSPAKAAPFIGCKSAAHVRTLILTGQLDARDVGSADAPRYKVSMAAIERFNRKARQKVLDRIEKLKAKERGEEAA
jgi:hypothetical protein